jgi:hypothetical protein
MVELYLHCLICLHGTVVIQHDLIYYLKERRLLVFIQSNSISNILGRTAASPSDFLFNLWAAL